MSAAKLWLVAARPRTLPAAVAPVLVGTSLAIGEGTFRPLAFCSGGDQRVRGDSGYMTDEQAAGSRIGRFHVTDLHVQMRRTPKPIVAMVAGYAVGGGHVLHVICDLTIAADTARFGQAGPRVGSFDAGFGTGVLARVVGEKKAREGVQAFNEKRQPDFAPYRAAASR